MAARAPSEPKCPGCGYSLTGLGVGPCPECGRWVDPSRPGFPDGAAFWHALATFAPHRIVNWFYAIIVSGLFLLLCSPTGQCSDLWWFVAGLFIMGTIASWSPLFAMHLLGRAMLGVKRVHQSRWRWGWIIAPAVLMGCVVIQQSGWVWQARWWVSQGRFAELAAPGAPLPARPGRVGMFYIVKAERRSDGTILCVLSFPDVYSQGPVRLVYSPGIDPGGAPVSTDVGGGWWALVDPT